VDSQDRDMDDEAAIRAYRAAAAAAAWLNAPQDVAAYSRLVAAVDEWNAYHSPTLADLAEEEVLDQLADANPPQPLGTEVAELEKVLRSTARRAL
jgi:hypothetical protein